MTSNQLKAAFRKVKLTPEVPSPLQGYDPKLYIADSDKDLLNDLFARIAVIDDGFARKVILSMDCCLVSEQDFLASDPDGNGGDYRILQHSLPNGSRHRWALAGETSEDAVLVSATHTHSAPAYFDEECVARVEEEIGEAIANLMPIHMKIATGFTEVAVNRRPLLQHNDNIQINKDLNVVVFEQEDGKWLGAMVNCAVHPTLLCNPFNRISSEFVGMAMEEWEEKTGGDFISLFIQGFSGDVGPYGHYRNEPFDTYPLVKQQAHKLFQNIVGATRQLTEVNARTTIEGISQTIMMPINGRL
ncbi:hypothetical protein ACX1C1_12910 [Paenibacillus sp. strain BS8-2]